MTGNFMDLPSMSLWSSLLQAQNNNTNPSRSSKSKKRKDKPVMIRSKNLNWIHFRPDQNIYSITSLRQTHP